MSEAQQSTAPQEQPEDNHFITKLMRDTVQSMTRADEEGAVARIQTLRAKHPSATTDELAERVIRRKCMQAGAIGAVTASPTLVPGLGTVIALTFGTAVDIGMMYKLQGELVLELIELYAPHLGLENKRKILMIVTGISIGASRLLGEQGQAIAAKASTGLTRRLGSTATAEVVEGAATSFFARSVSVVLGVGTLAGINMVTTYTIGRRAQAYLKQGPEAMEDLPTSLRTISGVDERKLSAWLMASTQRSWQLMRSQSHDLGAKLATASQSARALYQVQAHATGRRIVEAGSYLADRSGEGFIRLIDLGKQAGVGVRTGAEALVNGVRDKLKRGDEAQESAVTEVDVPPPAPTPAADSPAQGG